MKIRKRVRRLTKGKKKILWECDLGVINGKRIAYCFRTEQEAKDKLAAEGKKLREFGASSFALTEDERLRFTAARVRLAKLGASIEQAVDFYIAEHPELAPPITLAALLKECVLAKELAGRRDRYVSQFGVSCRSFVAPRLDRLADTIKREEVQSWISSNGWAPKTQRVYLGDLRALFSYAVEKRYAARNPAAGRFDLKQTDPAEIAALGVEQARALLLGALAPPAALLAPLRREWSRPPLLWYVVLGLFAGIRPIELARMDRSQVDLVERHAIVTARNSKTRSRRVVDLSANAIAWLKIDPLRTGPICPPNFERMWGSVRFHAGFAAYVELRGKREPVKPEGHPGWPWPDDAMRHTFASMHYAFHQNETLLKAQMGHSKAEDTLMQHYRALKTRREAEAFWSLRPEGRKAGAAPAVIALTVRRPPSLATDRSNARSA